MEFFRHDIMYIGYCRNVFQLQVASNVFEFVSHYTSYEIRLTNATYVARFEAHILFVISELCVH
jgi:hypothetical protein